MTSDCIDSSEQLYDTLAKDAIEFIKASEGRGEPFYLPSELPYLLLRDNPCYKQICSLLANAYLKGSRESNEPGVLSEGNEIRLSGEELGFLYGSLDYLNRSCGTEAYLLKPCQTLSEKVKASYENFCLLQQKSPVHKAYFQRYGCYPDMISERWEIFRDAYNMALSPNCQLQYKPTT